jgi:hypothetical protein
MSQTTHRAVAGRLRTTLPRAIRPVRRAISTIVGPVLLAISIAACNGILDVSLPGKVDAGVLDNPALAATMVTSAQADFECAFSEYVHSTGLWANELWNSSGGAEVNPWGARLSTYDAGTGTCPTEISNRGAFDVYLPLQIARVQADSAVARLDRFTDADVPNRAVLLARAAAYSGYAYTLLGEAYCEMALDASAIVAPSDVLAIAEQRFSRAIDMATSAGDASVLNMALVGRARVRLDLGNTAGAASDAELVPHGFVYNATYDLTPFRRNNTVVLNNNVNFHESVAPEFRNLTVDDIADPRVPVEDAGRFGQDAVTPLWVQKKYLAVDSPIPIATWDEAQLIIAEAEGGDNAVTAINAIRDEYGLPHYGGGTDEEIMDQILEERRRTLFLDGHAIGDHLRYGIPFATGLNQKGVRYGDLTCLPLPPSELSGR